MIVTMESDHAALAALVEDVGRALVRYAGRLRLADIDSSVVAQEVATATGAASPPASSPAAPSTAARSAEYGPLDVNLRRLGVSGSRRKWSLKQCAQPGRT